MDKEIKEVRKVTSGHIKEKRLGDKIAESFFSEDTKTVGDYFLWDLLIPGIKDAAYDLVGRILFGGGRSSSRRDRGRSHVSYQSYYDSDDRRSARSRVDRSDRDARYDFSDIILDSRGDAEAVVLEMERLVKKYDSASVADLCSAVGVNSKHTDLKWGWTDCRDFNYRRSGRGYILDFAPPEFLDD